MSVGASAPGAEFRTVEVIPLGTVLPLSMVLPLGMVLGLGTALQLSSVCGSAGGGRFPNLSRHPLRVLNFFRRRPFNRG